MQRENFLRQNENGSFQNVSDFDDEQSRGGIQEHTRPIEQLNYKFKSPYTQEKPRNRFHIRPNYSAPNFVDNGSFQNVSNFDDEQTRGGISEQARRMQQSTNPVNTPYKPDWKPRQSYTARRNVNANMNKSLQEEESGFHFRIAKLNCNYSPAISKFSVCSNSRIFHEIS